jgi:predicted DNA-binding protein
MAKKKAAPKVSTVAVERETKPVRLDLSLADHERIERSAKRFGLSKSAYVRQALFERLESDEGQVTK